jgi:hypothetical protein
VLERGDAADASRDRAALDARWRGELEAARLDAGILPLRIPALLDPQRYEKAFAVAHAAVRREGGWLATRKEYSDWTRARKAVRASIRRAGPRRLVVEITNLASAPVEKIVLRVHLNEPASDAHVEATTLGQEAAQLRFAAGAERADLALPRLDARRSAAYSLDYAPAADAT